MHQSGCNRRAAASLPAAAAALALLAAAPARADEPRQAVADTVDRREVALVVGEQIAIPTEGVAEFSEGVKGVVDFKRAKESPTHFVLLGLAPGKTSLLMLMRDGRQLLYLITVTPRDRAGAVAQRDNIRLDMYFVELSSGGSYQVGLVWPGTAHGTGALQPTIDLSVQSNLRPRRVVGATATITSQVLPRLDFAESAGWARVLRHASLTASNGETGTFDSGGEVNVKIANGLSVGLEQIKHGTRIKVTPHYDRKSGRVDVRIEAEVATLAGAAVDGLPGRNVTTVNTAVNLRLGQAIVLGGLRGKSERQQRGGLAYLSRIPVLGYLFGARSVERDRTENILVIVPTVSDSVPPEDGGLVEDALEGYFQFHGGFRAPLDTGSRPLRAKRRAK